MLTIFSPMRPFESLIGKVQINAIESWLRLDKNIQIILFEDEEKSIYNYVKPNNNILIIKDFNRSISGVPLLDSMYEKANLFSKHDILCYLTADLILPKDFVEKIKKFNKESSFKFKNFVGVSARYDLTDENIHRNKNENIESYYKKCEKLSVLRERSGIDLWITRKNQKIEFLPFPIGRCLTDNWFIYNCKKNNIKIIDVSNCFKIIHQNHDKPSKSNQFFELEKYICHHIFKGASYNGGDIHDSDLIYNGEKFKKPKGIRKIQLLLYNVKLYRILLSVYRMLRIKYYRIELL